MPTPSKPVPRKPTPTKLVQLKPKLRLSMQFADPRHRADLPRHRVRRWLSVALPGAAQITVRWVDEAEGLALNSSYRQQDHATNVLTFDYEHEPEVVADLVLCAPVVAREARQLRRSLQAHYAHLLVHGALHARGLDHQTDEAAEQMEALESALMLRLGFEDPYRSGPAARLRS